MQKKHGGNNIKGRRMLIDSFENNIHSIEACQILGHYDWQAFEISQIVWQFAHQCYIHHHNDKWEWERNLGCVDDVTCYIALTYMYELKTKLGFQNPKYFNPKLT
jgi:hypothetical protein